MFRLAKIVSDMLNLIRDLQLLSSQQIEEWEKELKAQGHKDTGTLIQSLRSEVSNRLNEKVSISYFSEQYGIYVDKGVKAANVKYSPYVLLDWAARKRPSLSQKELLGFVVATKKKHEKTGIPSPNSFSFSQNGRRKEWIQYGVDEVDYNRKLDPILERFVDALVKSSINTVLAV